MMENEKEFVMLVDDNPANLRIGKNVLSEKYSVATAPSAEKMFNLLENNNPSIILLDIDMPEMDGIEATAAIRAWEAEQGTGRSVIPIIALTANAVSGMREMFIEKDFSDFLAKPIDISKLDEILDRWIPREKKGNGEHGSNDDTASGSYHDSPNNNHQSQSPIPGVDIETGLYMTGGSMAIYRQVLDSFREDAEERLPALQNAPDTGALPGFINHVHALKSASASIGAAELSARTEKLEVAGKAGGIDFIREDLPGFAEHLAEPIGGIQTWESEQDV
jgi:CheY-like chemotaxis protein